MAAKNKGLRPEGDFHKKFRIDPLEEIEAEQGVEISGKMHDLAQAPVKKLKRGGSHKESYRHTRHKG